MAVQIIKDDEGNAQYAVIPYDEYLWMCFQMAEIDDETDDDLEDIEIEHDIYDDVELPGEVCSIMTWQDVSLQAAWRIHRGLSQQEVADKLGISQSAVSQLEAVDSRPQKRTREKLAAIYGCKQEQISLYLPKEG
ncbi:helix-turn-helix domain-containing protein [Leclercia barmai]|uniref:Helix-turn-helix transcriptional regulator n=1 Tax=Leclercia barmai TaxID=2785629 RepID=A0ABS7RXE0_9ENTR|nr:MULTISPECIES: helix-turn-helix transcriptional regulator [unclassified Leclercia]MBZ0058977.1 helix-turn-helix transcriptional regulator [Leclercia sp. EMC7]MCM5697013.1 helix-turn-helix domain-containing protein [Leclercia sp. LTM01]MCM5701157.1 helix-turn-helix domain-containing protein [Leclercia sp. LTM14]